MAYASRSGRAITNPQNPRAFAVCDRCGMWYNHYKQQFQHEWQGTKLQNLNLLVCQSCLDIPQPQLKARILPADPVPIRNPRPEWFGYIENNSLAADGSGPPISSIQADGDGIIEIDE
jgi:hypothetical protein